MRGRPEEGDGTTTPCSPGREGADPCRKCSPTARCRTISGTGEGWRSSTYLGWSTSGAWEEVVLEVSQAVTLEVGSRFAGTSSG